MKELTIQEKASRYDEAIEKAKKHYEECKMRGNDWFVEDMEDMFPELKENEDEKTREEITEFFKNYSEHGTWKAISDVTRWIAWLENQGKPVEINPTEFDLWLNRLLVQFESLTKEELASSLSFYLNVVKNGWPYKIEKKQGEKVDNANKVEPKFKIGDWVVSPNGVYWHIDVIRDGRYQVSSDSGGSADWPLDTNIYHKFTIQDAKDGDVLYSPSHRLIWIYKDNEHYYACVNMNYVTKNVATNGLIIIPNDACPATKDEQTILFARMKESDYEWDAEKKELKEIEHKHFCELDNSCACVKFPFKAKVKSTGTIVAIHDGQLSPDGKEWIKYQSDKEDGFKIYEPNNLELVCEIEQKSAKFREGDNIQFKGVGHNRYTIREVCGLSHYINTNGKRMDMSYTDANFEVIKDSDLD